MTDNIQHDNTAHEGYEHQDLGTKSILYFLLALAVSVVLSIFGLKVVYAYLDHRERADQPPISPLATNVPTDTRHIPGDYPQAAFPNPRLEKIEGEELDRDLLSEQEKLYSYGWVDEKSGTVRIPIDRAMDLIVQRGLPVRQEGAINEAAAPKPATKKDKKK